ncbi:MAG: CheR family methyltransferase [Pseudomonadota bacterium]
MGSVLEIPSQPETVSNADIARFAEFFHRQTGIVLPDQRQDLIRRRLERAVERHGAKSFRDFLLRLKTDPGGASMQEVINLFTVNETYFYREAYQFESMVAHALPEIMTRRRAGLPIKIWCMPCATGEEPFSLAIYLLENWPGIQDIDVEIMGSDIDTNALKAARRASYSSRSVSRLPDTAKKKYFNYNNRNETYQLSPDIVDAVGLSTANILDPASIRKFKDVDIIFCRNLLIYFDDAGRKSAVANLYDCMRPGGYIFLGHSESMSRISTVFEPRRHGDLMLYRRRQE